MPASFSIIGYRMALAAVIIGAVLPWMQAPFDFLPWYETWRADLRIGVSNGWRLALLVLAIVGFATSAGRPTRQQLTVANIIGWTALLVALGGTVHVMYWLHELDMGPFVRLGIGAYVALLGGIASAAFGFVFNSGQSPQPGPTWQGRSGESDAVMRAYRTARILKDQVALVITLVCVVGLILGYIIVGALTPNSGRLEFSNPLKAQGEPSERPSAAPTGGARLSDKKAAPAGVEPQRRGRSSSPTKLRITLANYNKIKPGMTESEVEAILGPGTEQASSSIDSPGFHAPGVDVQGQSMSASNKVWEHGFKIITITFLNGRVQGKAQVGL